MKNQLLQDKFERIERQKLEARVKELEFILKFPAIDTTSASWSQLRARVRTLSRIALGRLTPADFEPRLTPIVINY